MIRDPRYHALDGWRGLICLYVVLEHAGVALWGGVGEATGLEGFARQILVLPLRWNIGTPLFFVISGYCIAASTDSHRRKALPAKNFLLRRVWRIFPPYWTAVLLFVLTVAILDAMELPDWHRNGLTLELASPGDLHPWQWLGNLTLTEGWRWHVVGPDPNIYTRIGWSLGYQEQFYLICFLALLAFPKGYVKALAITTAATVLHLLWAHDIGYLHRLDGYFLTRWHEFAVGLAVYWRINYAETSRGRRGVDLLLASMLALSAWFGVVSSMGASAFGLLMIAMRRWDYQIASCRWVRPLTWCGRRSYSIYLTHLPICILVVMALETLGVRGFWARTLVSMPAAVAASVGIGWAFHRWVDSRFTTLPDPESIRRIRERFRRPSAPLRANGAGALPA
jgi:peptidoglycan/LPS O-acetylase OafA/YrhL